MEASSSCLVFEAAGRLVHTMVYFMVQNFPSRAAALCPASTGLLNRLAQF